MGEPHELVEMLLALAETFLVEVEEVSPGIVDRMRERLGPEEVVKIRENRGNVRGRNLARQWLAERRHLLHAIERRRKR